jgi:hypothetical protein
MTRIRSNTGLGVALLVNVKEAWLHGRFFGLRLLSGALRPSWQRAPVFVDLLFSPLLQAENVRWSRRS